MFQLEPSLISKKFSTNLAQSLDLDYALFITVYKS